MYKSCFLEDIINTFLLPDYAHGFYLQFDFTIAPWNKRNIDTTCGGWIVLKNTGITGKV